MPCQQIETVDGKSLNIGCVCVCMCMCVCLFTCYWIQEVGKFSLSALGCKQMVLLEFPPLLTLKEMSVALLHPSDSW